MPSPDLIRRQGDESLPYYSESGPTVYQSKPTPTIITTEDRLFRRLSEHKEAFVSSFGWAGPLALFATTGATVVTAEEFKYFIVDGPVWNAFFLILTTVSFFWLLIEIIKLFIHFLHFRSFSASAGINHAIKKIKDDSDELKSRESFPLESYDFPILGEDGLQWVPVQRAREQ